MFFLNLFSVFNRIEDFLLSGKIELILPCRSERINLSSSLRMEKIVGVSAAHGRNIAELKEQITTFLKNEELTENKKSPQTVIPDVRIAILGKPNTGKSTLSNWLLKEEGS